MKGVGDLTYHLGCDFGRDPDGTFFYAPYKYIEKILAGYERIFGASPSPATSPLVKNDHPELDTSPELDLQGRSTYMSLIGQCQWLISLGRFDISCAALGRNMDLLRLEKDRTV